VGNLYLVDLLVGLRPVKSKAEPNQAAIII